MGVTWGGLVTSIGVTCDSDAGLEARPAEVLLEKLDLTPNIGKGRPEVQEMLGPGGQGGSVNGIQEGIHSWGWGQEGSVNQRQEGTHSGDREAV